MVNDKVTVPVTEQNEYETKSTGAFINRSYTLHDIIAPYPIKFKNISQRHLSYITI